MDHDEPDGAARRGGWVVEMREGGSRAAGTYPSLRGRAPVHAERQRRGAVVAVLRGAGGLPARPRRRRRHRLARRRPRGTVVVGSELTSLPRRRADDSSRPLLGSRLEGGGEGEGAEADAVAVGRTDARRRRLAGAPSGGR